MRREGVFFAIELASRRDATQEREREKKKDASELSQ